MIDHPNVRRQILERIYMVGDKRRMWTIRPVKDRSMLIFDQASYMDENMKEQTKDMFVGAKVIVELQ